MKEYSHFQMFIRRVSLFLIKIAFRPKIYFLNEKAEKEAFKEPCVIICNHTFAFNGAVIGSLFKKENIKYLLAKDLIKGKISAYYYKTLGCIPIDRQKPDTSWLHTACDAIKKGGSVCIFPEGKVSFDLNIAEFKPGFLMLSAASGASILPMAIVGKRRLFLNRQIIMVGETQKFDGAFSAPNMANETRKYRETVLKLRDEIIKREKEKKLYGKLFLRYARRGRKKEAEISSDSEQTA